MFFDALLIAFIIAVGSRTCSFRLKKAYNNLVDKHYVFTDSGTIYIVRRCDNLVIEIDDSHKTLTVYTSDGISHHYTYDFIEEFKDKRISDEYEEHLINQGALIIK